MEGKKTIQQIIEEKAKKRRCKIGISIINETPKILKSLKKAKNIADIIIYSNHKIKGFEAKIIKNNNEIGRSMVADYRNGKIDQFVRGQSDDWSTVDEFKKQFNIPKNNKRLHCAFLEDIKKRGFFLTCASNREGHTLSDKKRISIEACRWMKKEFGVNPKVAVMATCRPGTVGRDKITTKSYREAENLVKLLEEEGYEAKNIHIELQNALPWANLIIPSNGTIGNQIFRALVLLGGGKNLLTPTIFPEKGFYEDNSSNEQDYYSHIIFSCAMANGKQ